MNDIKSNNFDYPPTYNAPSQPQSTYNSNNPYQPQIHSQNSYGNFNQQQLPGGGRIQQTTTPIAPMMNQQSMLNQQPQTLSPQMTGQPQMMGMGQHPQMMHMSPQMTGMNASMGGQQQPAMMMNVMMTPGGVLPPQNLLLICQQNGHSPTTRYGVCGIITAILCFPIGLVALCIDVERYCTRCGTRL